MEKRRLHRGVCGATAALLAFVLLGAAAVGASANSALYLWEGTASGGIAVVGGECPVVVEHETLVFTVDDLPTDYGDENMDEYAASVTAEYAFYNPADYAVRMTLAFPYGTLPEYVPAGFDAASRCTVAADGAAVSVRQRGTYRAEGDFRLEESLAQLSDAYREDDFFAPDLPVTVYAYKIEADAVGEISALVTFPQTETSRVFVSGRRIYAGGSGRAAAVLAENGELVWIAVAGEAAAPVWERFESVGGGAIARAGAELLFTRQTDFERLALWFFAGAGQAAQGVPSADWYNAVLDALAEEYSQTVPYSFSDLNVRSRLLRWLEYELSIPAGGRVTNAVTAPLYPQISRVSDSRTTSYTYTYLLSPAQSWADFGSLSVEVRTPYPFRSYSAAFAREGNVYAASFDALPEGELTFTLRQAGEGGANWTDLVAVLLSAGAALVLTGAGLLIWFLVRRRTRKKAERAGKE